MEIEKIIRTNLESSIDREMTQQQFFAWVKEFTGGELVYDRITPKMLDKLSVYVEQIEFSEDHRILFVDYNDEVEAEVDEIESIRDDEPDVPDEHEMDLNFPESWRHIRGE